MSLLRLLGMPSSESPFRNLSTGSLFGDRGMPTKSGGGAPRPQTPATPPPVVATPPPPPIPGAGNPRRQFSADLWPNMAGSQQGLSADLWPNFGASAPAPQLTAPPTTPTASQQNPLLALLLLQMLGGGREGGMQRKWREPGSGYPAPSPSPSPSPSPNPVPTPSPRPGFGAGLAGDGRRGDILRFQENQHQQAMARGRQDRWNNRSYIDQFFDWLENKQPPPPPPPPPKKKKDSDKGGE